MFLHESLKTIDTIIIIAIISGQKLQRDISSLNKFVSFITCFYFQLFFPVISLVERNLLLMYLLTAYNR